MKLTQIATLDDIIDTEEIIENFCPSMGHKFRFAFSVFDLVREQPYVFRQDIETDCESLSTSWTFEFVFKQSPNTSIVTCNLTAKRTDSINRTVKASIELSSSYVEYPCQQFQQLFTNEYKPGQEIEEFCDDMLPFPESEMYLDGGIAIEVSLAVKCCDP